MTMDNNIEPSQTTGRRQPFYTGRVVYVRAFDLAYDMKRERLKTLMGMPMEEYYIGPSKRSPKQLFFYRPQMVRLQPVKTQIDGRDVDVKRTVKLFNVGAISICFSVPFEVENIDQLVTYHEPAIGATTIDDCIVELAEQLHTELLPYCVRPVPQLGPSEDYTVFCIDALPAEPDNRNNLAEEWLMAHRREVAGLLTQEQDAAGLSRQEAAESTERYLSYYESDLVVIDWDAALAIGERDSLDDILHIMELANVQLVELEAYDRTLDIALETAYRHLAGRRVKTEVHERLREIRIDAARLSDELLNITKFFGDWHLAKIYEFVADRFHLADWNRIMAEKLRTLGELYQMLQQDRMNYWMIVLEATIVLLFIIDLIVLIMGL